MIWLAFLVALAFVVFVVLAYRRRWRWTGLTEVHRTRVGDEDGLGKFSVSERAAREGRNPVTGEMIQIAASRAAKFSAPRR
jgi:hypothetical protein